MPTATTLCHMLPVMVKPIVSWRIMFFFAAKGMITAKKVVKESWYIGLFTGNRQATTRTKTAIPVPNAATFGKFIAGQLIMYSFAAKRNNNKK